MPATNEVSSLSLQELDALLKKAREQKKAIVEAEQAAIVKAVTPSAQALAEAIVPVAAYRESEKSPWAGFAISQVTVTVEGVEYTVNATLTDVKRKDARTKEMAKATS